jgi:hypothetical protein
MLAALRIHWSEGWRPQVNFTDDFDWETHEFGIAWFDNTNTILVSNSFAPFVREVGRWCEKVTASKAIVEQAVRGAYQIELAATIIYANAQAKFKLGAEQIEELKSDAALYAKTLGMQALTERIESYIKTAMKNA